MESSNQFLGTERIGKLVAEHLGIRCNDAANYHIALDSGVIGIEKCTKVIESLA